MSLQKLYIKEYPHCRQITGLSLVPHTGLPIVRGIGMHFADQQVHRLCEELVFMHVATNLT